MSNTDQNQQGQQPQQPQENQVRQNRNYNPFIDVVNEKPYTQMNVATNPSQMTGAIPEPVFKPNTVRTNENAYGMLNDDFGSAMGNAASTPPPINPAMNKIPSQEQQAGAEQLAKMIVEGYDQAWTFANRLLQISPKKLRKLVAEGEIDLSVQIPYDYGKTISAGEFVDDLNNQNKDTLSVSKEFKKDVTPVLARVLAKRGAGLTDEQYLMYAFGKDSLTKLIIVYQVKGAINDAIDVIKDYTLALRQNGGIPTPPESGYTPPPNNPTPPSGNSNPTDPTAPPVRPEPIIPQDSDRYNFETNETVMASTVQKHHVPNTGKARAMAAKKKDEEMVAAVERANSRPSYEDAISSRKTGKRGRRPKDYIKNVDESEIADAIILSESKDSKKDVIEGLD